MYDKKLLLRFRRAIRDALETTRLSTWAIEQKVYATGAPTSQEGKQLDYLRAWATILHIGMRQIGIWLGSKRPQHCRELSCQGALSYHKDRVAVTPRVHEAIAVKVLVWANEGAKPARAPVAVCAQMLQTAQVIDQGRAVPVAPPP